MITARPGPVPLPAAVVKICKPLPDVISGAVENQDPTNPMENNELTTQLAQINTVSGIEKLNTTLGAITGQIDSSQSLYATSLIGRGVMVPGTNIFTGSTDGTVSTTPLASNCNDLRIK